MLLITKIFFVKIITLMSVFKVFNHVSAQLVKIHSFVNRVDDTTYDTKNISS